MKNKALIWYGSAFVLLIIALVIFLNSLDWKAIVILVLGMAAVLLFRQGIAESKKKNDTK
jgi:4-hydroxybenzoate polyprenyltransferase